MNAVATPCVLAHVPACHSVAGACERHGHVTAMEATVEIKEKGFSMILILLKKFSKRSPGMYIYIYPSLESYLILNVLLSRSIIVLSLPYRNCILTLIA